MTTRRIATLTLLVASIAGGAIFQVLAEEREESVIRRGRAPFEKTFQMEVETSDRWTPTLTAAQREKAARAAIFDWCKAFANGDLEAAVTLSGVPFWMDGNLLDSEESLRADFKRQMPYTYKPTEFVVEKDFSQVVKALDYPMNGMLLRVSDGTRRMGFTVQFGKSVVVVAVDKKREWLI